MPYLDKGEKIQQEAQRPYCHRSIRDFTLTSCQKGAYLHINNPVIIINKLNDWIGKQHNNPLTIATNVTYIDREDNTYSI